MSDAGSKARDTLDALVHIRDHDPEKKHIASQLKRLPLFLDLSPEEIEILAQRMRSYRAERGDIVFIEGQRSGYLCVIIEGGLDIVKDSGKGKSRKINTVDAGKLIGEMSMIDGLPHSATAVANSRVLLDTLTEPELEALVEENPVLGAKIYRIIARLLSQRMRRVNDVLVDFLD
jgi:CRP/FNR family cyclic AMP-dependent transcriptional regulator